MAHFWSLPMALMMTFISAGGAFLGKGYLFPSHDPADPSVLGGAAQTFDPSDSRIRPEQHLDATGVRRRTDAN